MARKSLRPHLNQIREWVRQGRTDAWIAHQLEITTAQLRDFRRQHNLVPEGEEGETAAGELDLRDEIEAEIEAAAGEDEADEVPAEEALEPGPREEKGEESGEAKGEESGERPGEGERPRRRRRRRGRRGRGGRPGRALEATFDHGETDGYGLWLDPAVREDPIYAEHWAGHRPVTVSIEPDRIVIQRAKDEK